MSTIISRHLGLPSLPNFTSRRREARRLPEEGVEFEQLEKDGIIGPSDSPWSSPLLQYKILEIFTTSNLVTEPGVILPRNTLDFAFVNRI
jgi:hypothetical protein